MKTGRSIDDIEGDGKPYAVSVGALGGQAGHVKRKKNDGGKAAPSEAEARATAREDRKILEYILHQSSKVGNGDASKLDPSIAKRSPDLARGSTEVIMRRKDPPYAKGVGSNPSTKGENSKTVSNTADAQREEQELLHDILHASSNVANGNMSNLDPSVSKRSPDLPLASMEVHDRKKAPPYAGGASNSGDNETGMLTKKEGFVQGQDSTQGDMAVEEISPIPSAANNQPSRSQSTPGAYSIAGIGGPSVEEESSPSPLQEEQAAAVRFQPQPNNSGLLEAQPIMDEDSHHPPNQEAQEYDMEAAMIKKNKQQQKLQTGLLLAVILVVAVSALVVGLVFGLRTEEKENTPSPTTDAVSQSPSASPTALYDFLLIDLPDLPNSTVQRIIENPLSHQARGYEWLRDHPNITAMPDWRKVQLFALATFYYAFEGPHWPRGVRDSWMQPDTHECSWFNGFADLSHDSEWDEYHHNTLLGFVPDDFLGKEELYFDKVFFKFNDTQCDESMRINSIILNQMALGGHHPVIPPEIALLTSLKNILLELNDITHVGPPGFIPTEIGLMSELKEFRNWGNNISDTIPSELGLCTKMTNLQLLGNAYHGSIPSQIFSLTLLDELWLYHNFLTGTIPTEVGLLDKLIVLNIHQNAFTGQVPSEIGDMEYLKWMNLQDSMLTGTLPTEIGTAPNLEIAWLQNNQFTGHLPSELGKVPNLMHFHVTKNQISGGIPTQLAGHANLTELGLANNRLSGSIPLQVQFASSLIFLDIADNALSGPLSASEFSTAAMDHSLRYLNIEGNPLLSGTVPEDLCCLNLDSSCEFQKWYGIWVALTENRSCTFGFDCSEELCGCGCPCGANETATRSNFTSANCPAFPPRYQPGIYDV